MNIFIARHAWAYEFGDPRWPDDSQRELEPEGAERYMQVVQTLAERGFAPELVATSPYTRCAQTAEIIAEYTSQKPDVVPLDALEPGSSFEALLKWSRDSECESVCWVGHAPDVGWLTAALVGDSGASLRFAKGSVASVRMDEGIVPGAGELMWLATAKVLGV
ncbi:SixA phosphatase family protein [Bythopirellula polymerisocia]|uniref:Phosphohistidine phosphatase n=1 Tax=Bythopirellula polymerisocia TaxID=2528003 RepID=A0A5C6D200_9BACT|nr:histidine phosphatase family protein [Bythopirellula polymerisocia]TWU30155.1 phosphohistidine phosphatase [Bythopirellula polymerisocia]